MKRFATRRRFEFSSSNRTHVWLQLARETQFDEKEIAKRCEVTVRQLQRYFHEDLGRSPKGWLIEQRIVAARNLLMEGLPVKSVATRLGFKQSSHFCREFKRHHGITPREYLRIKRKTSRRHTAAAIIGN